MSPVDRRGVAERIRALTGAGTRENVSAIARRLAVSEPDLLLAIDDLAPHPAVNVLVALVRECGVDPNWLLTGEYNPATHHRALDEDIDGVAIAIKEIVRRETPPGGVTGISGEFPTDLLREFDR